MARCSGTVLLCLAAGSTAFAQSTLQGLRSEYVVDGRTASIQETFVPLVPLPPAPTFVHEVGDGPLWRYTDAGQGWIGRIVSLGDRGTQVFTEFDTGADRAEMFSGFDSTPVSPLFSDPQIFTSTDARVDAAGEAGVYVSCRQIPVVGSTGPRNTFVSKYTATGGLGWTYQFPGSPTTGPARALISRDGTRIVAGMVDATGQLQVRVFNASSSVPIFSTAFPPVSQLRAFLLSADGSTLYWATATTLNFWNVDTHQSMGQFILTNGLADVHAISADGGVLAYGGFNNVDVWERQAAGNYLRTYQWNVPGQAVCGKLDVSGNGSTIVAGFNLWDTILGVRILALDVPTKTQIQTDTAIGAGSYQNIVSDVSVNHAGDRFVVGLWGDEAGLVPEVRFYFRGASQPAATYNLPGSVYDVEISPDGNRVAVASKGAHANAPAGGGAIELYPFNYEDFSVSGIPSVGNTLTIDMWGMPSSPVRLIKAPLPAITPFNWANVGVLYLNRQTLSFFNMGTSGPDGHVVANFTLPTSVSLIGTQMCFQGLSTSPRRLTQTWVRMTLLP
jgi:WD40 repeat protein